LRYRDYALFWSSDLLGSLGHFVQEVALYWIAYEITESAMALGILGLCGAAPRLLLGALGGVLVDRYDRKRLLILIQFFSAIPVLMFLILYSLEALEYWHLLAVEILFGSIRAVNPSASQSILAELVPRKELMNAVSLYTIGFNFARIVGPSLGGILILWIGVRGCYGIFLISLIISGLGFMLMGLNDQRAANPEQDFVREFKQGFQYVWASPLIFSSIVAAYTFSIFIVTYQRFLPVFAKEIFAVGPEGLGLLMAAPGIGAIASLTFLASVGERWNRAWLLWITTSVTPIFLILFCFSPVFWISVVLLGLVGAGQVSFRTISRGAARSPWAGDERF
jgi:MFS family permease